MKAVGLITEYNPMHNGHIYHLNKSRELSDCDCAIAIMSGNFVQRGEPAIINKYARCEAAIKSGIDLCIELPSYFAVSSAEGFADGAIKTLNALGVDSVVFGSECDNTDTLKSVADILANEPAKYRTLLKENLANGMSFPAARQAALKQYSLSLNIDLPDNILSSPNNILGIEYIKSIIRHSYSIKPIALARSGTGYNETSINGLPSASAVRKFILDESRKCNKSLLNNFCKKYLPDAMSEQFNSDCLDSPIELDDMTPLFNYKMSELFNICSGDKKLLAAKLSSYTDISIDLANRMADMFTGMENISEYCLKVKSRQYTYSRISRCVLHIILDITKIKSAKYDGDSVPYIRILGFNDKGRKYLSHIKKNCEVPIITKTADFKELLTDDIHCSSIYNQLIYNKYKTILKDEFRSGIYIQKQ